MDTKEAIEWIFDIWHEWENIYGISREQSLEDGKKMDEVIELLKRGEKYEAIVEKMKRFTNVMTMDIANDKIFELEQKYFPEGEK